MFVNDFQNCDKKGFLKYAMFMGPQACGVQQSAINGAQYQCMQKAYAAYSDTFGPFACPFECMVRNKETKIMNPMYNWMLPMMRGTYIKITASFVH